MYSDVICTLNDGFNKSFYFHGWNLLFLCSFVTKKDNWCHYKFISKLFCLRRIVVVLFFLQYHVHERRAYDTGRNGNHGNTDEADKTA